MNTIKKSFYVCQGYLKIEVKSFRIWFMWLVMFTVSYMFLEQIIRFSRQVGYRITPWCFVFYTTTRFVRIVFSLIFLTFICNLPFCKENDQIMLMRSGRKAFCIGNIGYAFINSCLYTILLAVSGVIFVQPTEWSWNWGKVFGTLAMTDAGSIFSIQPSSKLILKTEPVSDMLYSVLLMIGCYFFLGLVMILCNLFSKRKNIGIFVCGFFILFDFYVQVEPTIWRLTYLSPVSWSNLSILDIKKNVTIFPSLTYALSGYLVLCILLSLIIMINSKKLQISKEMI